MSNEEILKSSYYLVRNGPQSYEQFFFNSLKSYCQHDSSDYDLKECLNDILNERCLILDGFQFYWSLDRLLCIKIIQIVEEIKKDIRYPLILCGTPVYGNIDIIDFDEQTRLRVANFDVQPFTAIEIYSLLSKVVEGITFDIFFLLYTLFDGIVGLYSFAYEQNAFTADQYNFSQLWNILTTSSILKEEERIFIDSIDKKSGKVLSNDQWQHPTVNRLLRFGVITRINKIAYIQDHILSVYAQLVIDSKFNKDEVISKLSGFGLESLVKSIHPSILFFANIAYNLNLDVTSYEESSIRYGKLDIDLVLYSSKEDHYICISCKNKSRKQNGSIFENIKEHFETMKPKTISILLCSTKIQGQSRTNSLIQKLNAFNFGWSLNCSLYPVDVSAVVKTNANSCTVSCTENWGNLERKFIHEQILQVKSKCIRICGFRRVGKTTFIKEIGHPNVYIDLKQMTGVIPKPKKLALTPNT